MTASLVFRLASRFLTAWSLRELTWRRLDGFAGTWQEPAWGCAEARFPPGSHRRGLYSQCPFNLLFPPGFRPQCKACVLEDSKFLPGICRLAAIKETLFATARALSKSAYEIRVPWWSVLLGPHSEGDAIDSFFQPVIDLD